MSRRPSRSREGAWRSPGRGWTSVITALALAAIGGGGAGEAFGQTFEKFNESGRDQLPASPFVAAAYAFIWLALLTYVFLVARGLRRTQDEIQALKRRMDEGIGASLPRQ